MVDLEITYCQPCGHQPRAMQTVNQLLSTYGMPLNRRMSLTLKPADKGVFDVVVAGQLVFSRGKEDRFPTLDDIANHMHPKLSMQIEAPTASTNNSHLQQTPELRPPRRSP